MVAGIGETDAQSLSAAGDFLAVASGEVTRFRVPSMTDGEMDVVNQWVRQPAVPGSRWEGVGERNGGAVRGRLNLEESCG